MSDGRRLWQTTAGGSNELTAGLRQMADRDSNERQSKISKKRPPAVPMNRDWMLRGGTATECSDEWRRKLRQMTTGGSDEQWPKTPTNGGRRFWRNGGLKFRRTAAGGSNERRLKISKKRRPEVQMNEGRRLQGTAAGCSDKRRPEAPRNRGRMFRQTAAGCSDKWRPEAPTNGCRRFQRNVGLKFRRTKALFFSAAPKGDKLVDIEGLVRTHFSRSNMAVFVPLWWL